MNQLHSSSRPAATHDGRSQTLAGIGLELLGYARVAELLHRVAIAEQSRGGTPAEATPTGADRRDVVASQLPVPLLRARPHQRGAA